MDSDSNWRSSVSSNFDAGVLFTHLLLCVKFGYRVQFIVPKLMVRLNGKGKWKENRVWNSGKNKPLRQNSTVDYFRKKAKDPVGWISVRGREFFTFALDLDRLWGPASFLFKVLLLVTQW